MTIVGVIPARIGASRFPRKPLAPILGKPMIVRVLERARLATSLSRILVATDNDEIAAVVSDAGGEFVMTDPALPSGTDRVAAAVRDIPADIVLNIQGDEPALAAQVIDAVAAVLCNDSSIAVTTPAVPFTDETILYKPSAVKVVADARGDALYFSRAPIPFPRNPSVSDAADGLLHIGLYGYRRDALDWFCRTAPSPLERREGLEQLRFLEAGWHIRIVPVSAMSFGIDTPDDVPLVEALLREQGVA